MIFSSLPGWFWAIYYGCLLVAFSLSCFYLSQKKKGLFSTIGSAVNIWLILSVPLNSAWNSIGREGNEWDHFQLSFSQRESWTFYALGGYVYILLWTVVLVWLLLCMFQYKKRYRTVSKLK